MNVSINYPVAVVMGRHNSDFFFGYWSKLLFLKVLPKLRKTIAYSEEDPLQEGEGDKKTWYNQEDHPTPRDHLGTHAST